MQVQIARLRGSKFESGDVEKSASNLKKLRLQGIEKWPIGPLFQLNGLAAQLSFGLAG